MVWDPAPLPVRSDKCIFEQKGFWRLGESKIVSENEMYQKARGELKGEARVSRCRIPLETSSWKEGEDVWEAPVL